MGLMGKLEFLRSHWCPHSLRSTNIVHSESEEPSSELIDAFISFPQNLLPLAFWNPAHLRVVTFIAHFPPPPSTSVLFIPNPPQRSVPPDLLQQEQNAADQQPQHNEDPEGVRGDWDYDESNAQSYTQSSYEDRETAQESWNYDVAAHSYTESNWDDDGAQLGQGGWGDDGEAQVGTGGCGDGRLLSGIQGSFRCQHLSFLELPTFITVII